MNASNQLESASLRDCILRAVALLLQEQPYDKITASDVIRKASVSRSTFYRNFDSVDDAMIAMEDECLADFVDINRLGLKLRLGKESVRLSPTMALRMETFLEKKDFTVALLGPNSHPRFKQKEAVLMQGYLADKAKAAHLTPEQLDLYCRFMVDGHNSLVMRWLTQYPDLDLDEVATLINRLLYASLLVED